MKEDKFSRVILDNGEEISANAVASNADPRSNVFEIGGSWLTSTRLFF